MHIDLPIEQFLFPEMPLPEVYTVEQLFTTPRLGEGELRSQIAGAVDSLLKAKKLPAGAQIAVGVGSRGLDNLVLIVRETISALKQGGVQPFIFPAMGSHGGATAEGQTSLLAGYGITEACVGAPIRATMDVEQIGQLGPEAGEFAGQPCFCDKIAFSADAILLINRIKPHTDYSGEVESGIGKMCVIGIGKRHGAESIHRWGAHGLTNLLPLVARHNAATLKLLGGIALLENENGQTAEIHALQPHEIARERDKQLLDRSRKMAPRLMLPEIDILVVDEMGKNISGTGMDTHVIGRGTMPSIPEHTWGGPNVRLLAVLDLTEESHGNATSLGLADLTTQRLIEKTDFTATYINMRTSGEGGVLRARLPLTLPTSEECVRTAMATCGRPSPETIRLCRIHNTADTRFLEVTAALLPDVASHPELRLVSDKPHLLDLTQSVGIA